MAPGSSKECSNFLSLLEASWAVYLVVGGPVQGL
jgi:hypothetical protein